MWLFRNFGDSSEKGRHFGVTWDAPMGPKHVELADRSAHAYFRWIFRSLHHNCGRPRSSDRMKVGLSGAPAAVVDAGSPTAGSGNTRYIMSLRAWCG